MVMEYGMSDEIRTYIFWNRWWWSISRKRFWKSRNFSEEIGSKIDREIKKFIDEAYERTETIIKENIDKLHACCKRFT